METSFCGCTENIGEFGSSWGQKELTWHIAHYVQSIRDQQMALMELMFKDLSNRVCDLKFKYVTTPIGANLLYSVGRGSRAKFDGPRGTLAYAYLPPTKGFRGQLNLFFDLDEKWSPKRPDHSLANDEGIRFFNVCYHETLHSLGLDHTSLQGQLMAPTYNARVAVAQDEDVKRLRALYGAPNEALPLPAGKVESRIEIEIDGIMRKGKITWE